MAWPTLSVQVAFDDDPLATSPTWTTITSYVRSIETTSGRARELDTFDVGTATVVLDNNDRRFDPLHAAGPYFGKLLPNKRVRIRATHGGTTYDVWYGWVDGWPQSYDDDGDNTVTVPCSDAFKLLSRLVLPGSVYESVVLADGPVAWWRLQETNGTTFYDASGNEAHAASRYGVAAQEVEKGPALIVGDDEARSWPISDGVQAIADVAPTFVPDPPATIEFWALTPDATRLNLVIYTPISITNNAKGIFFFLGFGDPTYKNRPVVYDSDNGGYLRATTDVVNDGRIHHVVFRTDGTDWDIYVDGVGLLTASTGTVATDWNDLAAQIIEGGYGIQVASGPQVDIVGAMGEIAVYPDELTGLEILDHYNAGSAPWDGDTTGERVDRALALRSWPAVLKDIDTGQTTLGPANLARRSMLDYLRSVAAAEQGQLYADHRNGGKVTFRERHHRLTDSRSTTSQATLSDEDTAGVYHYEHLDIRYDEREIINAVDVTWLGGTVTVIDQDSIDTYGRNGRKIDTELATPTEANSLGEWVVARYKTPQIRCRKITLNAAAYQAAFDLLDLKIGDRVTVRKLPVGTGTAIELDLLIEGIGHAINDGINEWTVDLYVSQAEAGPWFVWGTAEWDDTALWAW